ncbi:MULTISPECIES: fimbria/pilus outer membrane usher protein [Enterobacter]|uniref:fimbria/pilus outer membrane usher protein n=1 Tax=Enterobacter TaxID=547 RepID=UPI0007AD9CF1|nr:MULTISPECIES: fimbria/pilus outer membrane usher protein [Enterobacter]AMZ77762.1 hypothetical protein A4308_12440 [Enterobacter sp. ODB01]EKS6337590.1 fimbrial biogenesis outer membrane usher protein [Enterobacter hormaechei]VAL43420.1 outer membrane usher protein LpfC [Enterobacter kobei]
MNKNKLPVYGRECFPLSVLAAGIKIILLSALSSSAVPAAEYFNPALLSLGAPEGSDMKQVDLSRFEDGGQLPGIYRVDIYLNGQYMTTRDVNFVAGKGTELDPSLVLKEYRNLGLNDKAIPALRDTPAETALAPLGQFVPAATTQFDFATQRLNITIPQALMQARAQGYVDPDSWDEGVPAAILDYNITGNHTSYRGDSASMASSDGQYANLRSGLNLMGWRLRNYSTWNRNSSGQSTQSHFNSINTYLAHDVKSLQGEFLAGEYSTPGDVFDSVPFRGVQLASDQGMLPDSLRGFAPIIRGVANSDAQVTVRQSGSIIYQAYVPPGPFEIKDLYPSTDSGDLQVTVKEKDGSERRFTQAYSSVAIMQREGQVKYGMTMGELRDSGGGNSLREAKFAQATLIYGMPHSVTPYVGLLAAQKYLAATGGVGVSLGEWGAMSLDATQANATLTDGDKSQGQSYRIRYSKSMLDTGTTVTLAAYRYSTEGYYSFQDANTYRDRNAENGWTSYYRPRSEFQVALNQSLDNFGSVYLSGTQRDYWGRNGTERTYNAGYNTTIYGISYGLNLSQSKNSDSGSKTDKRLFFNMSVPLSRFLSGPDAYAGSSMNMNYSIATDQDHNTSQQVGVSGSALSDNQLNYNLNQSTGNHGQGYGGSMNATYNGSVASLTGGYNYGKTQQQLTYGMSGGIVAHPHGITLGQEPGETIAIVRAPGASGVKVNSQSGVKTDWRGYAIVPYLTPYRSTEVTIDPSNIGNDVAMDMTSARVVPTRGAVVMANYRTQVGRQAMLNLTFNGKPVPFGAMAVLDAAGQEDGQQAASGIVGDAGQLFMTGLPDEGRLNVQWGSDAGAHCSVPYRLPAERQDGVPVSVTAVCQ